MFEMMQGGLQEVPNPSALCLAERRGNVSGFAVLAPPGNLRLTEVGRLADLVSPFAGAPRGRRTARAEVAE